MASQPDQAQPSVESSQSGIVTAASGDKIIGDVRIELNDSKPAASATHLWSQHETDTLTQLCISYFTSKATGDAQYSVKEHWDNVCSHLEGRSRRKISRSM